MDLHLQCGGMARFQTFTQLIYRLIDKKPTNALNYGLRMIKSTSNIQLLQNTILLNVHMMSAMK